MPSRPARNHQVFTIAAIISGAPLVLASRSGHELSIVRPEPAPITSSAERADSSLASLGPCPPPSEALLASRHTNCLGESSASGLIPAHSSQHDLRQDQASDALPNIKQTVPPLPGPPLRILFCSWII